MNKALLFIPFVFLTAASGSDSMVDRWASAIGGRGKIAAIKSVYREATIQVGMRAI
jgi:hypothetical protein